MWDQRHNGGKGLKRTGEQKERGRPVELDYNLIWRMKEAGNTYREIAEKLKIGESSVGFALKKTREAGGGKEC